MTGQARWKWACRGRGEGRFRYRNRLKRVADALEKLGVAGMGLFRNAMSGFFMAVCLLCISVALTMEDESS